MTELLRLPSLRAAAALVPGWMLIVKLDRLRDLKVLEPLLPHMLGAYCDKSVKLRWDEEAGGFPDSPVAEEEFIDLEVCLSVGLWCMMGSHDHRRPPSQTLHTQLDSSSMRRSTCPSSPRLRPTP